MYQKEIIYLHLFDGEIRGSCVGYFKTEKKENRYDLELQVKNLPQGMTGSFPIRLQSTAGWREADMLLVKERDGKWKGTSEEQILRAEIIVSRVKKIKGESKSADVSAEEESGKAPDERTAEKVFAEKRTIRESAEERNGKANEKKDEEKGDKAEKVKENGTETESNRGKKEQSEPVLQIRGLSDEGRTMVAAERPHTSRSAVRGERTGKTEHAPLYENKWEQLLSTFEQIHPYGDNRIYVKLQPKDFIILRENYQHLVNNSFLLHGFYNYRYLILGKENDFYLGVPGVFYEREKMVALMFGFEAFECEGGEAEEGKFGYYLRKVEL